MDDVPTATGGDEVAVPADDVATVRRWCEGRVPVQMQERVRLECDVSGRHLTVIEARPPRTAWAILG